MTTGYDVIIVGAGTSGCALAARLSEDPSRRVLLVEAGAWFRGLDAYPPELKYGSLFGACAPGHPSNWGFAAHLRPGVQLPLTRGRVVGGSSALNGMIFTRGLPEDYDGWADAGNDLWSYESVLPFFKKLENDHDVDDEYHGRAGPVPVVRAGPSEWAPVARAFVAACGDAGFPEDPDMNGPKSIGVGALPVNGPGGIRFNTSLAYLDDIADRPNLTVRPDTIVLRVIVEGGRATGIAVKDGKDIETIRAGEVVLSAGAIKSPHLLMLSGIGPGDELRRHGVDVVVDAPHVGRNFTDHCTMHLPVQLPGLRRSKLDPTKTPLAQTGMHYTTPESTDHSDMMLFQGVVPLNAAILYGTSLAQKARIFVRGTRQMSWRKMLDQVRAEWDVALSIILMRGESRGEVKLLSADPSVQPELYYNYLDSPEDLRRMREGFRLAATLVASESYRDLGAKKGAPSDEVLESDALLDEYLKQHVGTSVHTSSTCRMGPSADDAVVDQRCRVHGVANLRVVDTSIMPTVVRRCPAATAVMIGERAAAFFD